MDAEGRRPTKNSKKGKFVADGVAGIDAIMKEFEHQAQIIANDKILITNIKATLEAGPVKML